LGFAAGQFWFASESLGVVGLLWMIRQRWFDTLLTTRSQRLNSWIDGRFALSLSDVSQLSYVVTVPFWETAVATRMSVNWGRWAPNVVHEVSLMDAMSTAFIVAGIGVAVIAALRKADRIAVYYT